MSFGAVRLPAAAVCLGRRAPERQQICSIGVSKVLRMKAFSLKSTGTAAIMIGFWQVWGANFNRSGST